MTICVSVCAAAAREGPSFFLTDTLSLPRAVVVVAVVVVVVAV